MNNFITVPRDSKDPSLAPKRRLETLVTDFFRSLFPQVAPQSTPLGSVKRVLLLNREPESDSANGTYTITLRHYAITTRMVGLSKAIKRINAAEKVSRKKVPNLGQLEDVSQYVLDHTTANYTSASESEADTDAEVEVLNPRTRTLHYRDKLEKIQAQGKRTRSDGKPAVEKRGIVLSEIGPRMRLRLIKVEENLCEGKIMWHEFVQKTHEEQLEMDKVWEQRKAEKAERKRIQKENQLKKRKERDALKGAAKEGKEGDQEDDGDEDYDYDMDSDLDSVMVDHDAKTSEV
jgi:ribosome biogenesis protein SSF1/2